MKETRLATVVDRDGKVLVSGTEEYCLYWLERNGVASHDRLHILYPGVIVAGQKVIEFGWTERGGVYWRGKKVSDEP